jgi:hypothetical protein
MTIYVDFEMDTKDGIRTVSVATAHSDLGAAATQIEREIESADPMLKLQDQKSGRFALIHTMKVCNVAIYEDNSE